MSMNLRGAVTASFVALSFASGSVLAADLPSRKAPLVAPVVMSPWAGAYVGVLGGWGGQRNNWTTTATGVGIVGAGASTNLSKSGAKLGLFAGYNWLSGNILTGIEADISADFSNKKMISGIPGTTGFVNRPYVDSVSGSTSYDGSLRGRLGYLVTPSVLIYATGGLAFANNKNTVSCPAGVTSWCTLPEFGSVSSTRFGWTLGGGLEANLTGNWFARVEYRYSDYGTKTNTFFAGRGPAGSDSITGRSRLTTNAITAGLSYHF